MGCRCSANSSSRSATSMSSSRLLFAFERGEVLRQFVVRTDVFEAQARRTMVSSGLSRLDHVRDPRLEAARSALASTGSTGMSPAMRSARSLFMGGEPREHGQDARR